MNRKTCRIIRQHIDELEPGQQINETAQAHLDSCSSCRDFRIERGALCDLVASLQPVSAPADFEIRLRARIAAEQIKPHRQFFGFPFVVSTPALASAALMVLAVVSLVWFVQRRTPEPVHPTAQATLPVEKAATAPASSAADDKHTGANDGNNLVATAGTPVKVGKRQGPRESISRVFNERPARSIKQSESNQVLVNAPREPLVISLENERGMTRKISLPPVSFGSQSLVDNRIPVSSTTTRAW